MEDHKKVFSTQILIEMEVEVEVEVVKLHFEVDMEARMVDIINMKVKLMEVDEETLEEEEVEEIVEVVVKIIEVNNQIATQFYHYCGKPGHGLILLQVLDSNSINFQQILT
jgi:hypothetical protein